MDKKSVEQALQELKKNSPKRKFSQSVDLIITMRDLDFKKPAEQVDFFVTCNYGFGKKIKVAALAAQELVDKAREVCDLVILASDFDKYQDKKLAKKLAADYDFFIAQAEIMPKVATVFGRTFGPRGKMPNPKLGSVIPGRGGQTQIQPLYDKLQKIVKVVAKKALMVQIKVGNESQKEEELIDNILTIYNQILHHLPKERSNIRQVMLKLTMSKPVKIMG